LESKPPATGESTETPDQVAEACDLTSGLRASSTPTAPAAEVAALQATSPPSSRASSQRTFSTPYRDMAIVAGTYALSGRDGAVHIPYHLLNCSDD
jgi:hypothetical protein